MEGNYYITVPMKDWDALQGEIDKLHDRLMDLNGKENVSVAKFVHHGAYPYQEFVIYTNSEAIIQFGKREESLKAQIDILYRELEKYNNKRWWQIWL